MSGSQYFSFVFVKFIIARGRQRIVFSTLMPKTSECFCLRRSMFKTILCRGIVDVVFLFRMSPSCRLIFVSRLVFCYFDEVARRGVLIAALTTRTIGFVGRRLSMFISFSLSESLALSFVPLRPFRLFCFSFAPSQFKLLVHGLT